MEKKVLSMQTEFSGEWRNFARYLASPSPNSYVFKAGFKYAIVWHQKSFAIEAHISRILGPPNKNWHYDTSSSFPVLKDRMFVSRRWFYGPQLWSDKNKKTQHWAVFKNETDRTIVLLSL